MSHPQKPESAAPKIALGFVVCATRPHDEQYGDSEGRIVRLYCGSQRAAKRERRWRLFKLAVLIAALVGMLLLVPR